MTRPGLIRLAALVAAFAASPGVALATTKVRIEWISAPAWRAGLPAAVYGAQSVSVSGSAAPGLSTAAPAFGTDSTGAPVSIGVARVTVISGAAVLQWGRNPVASESTGVRVQVGQEVDLVITTGQQVSVVEAADPPSAPPVSTNQ